ncbi:hypothetical protein Tco_0178252, partial [Tanacetum coccineum]
DVLGSMVPFLMLEPLSKRWIVRGERVGWFVTTDPDAMLKSAKAYALKRPKEMEDLIDKLRLRTNALERLFGEHQRTWMAFGQNTHDLGSFGEETNKITDLHQIHEEVLFTEHGDSVAGIKRRRRDLSSDGIRDLATTLGRGPLKEDLESST